MTENSSWWNDWVKMAKEQSLNVLNVVKNDLNEFTSTMQQDSSKIASTVKEKLIKENASSTSQKVKDGFGQLLGGLSKVLVVPPGEDDRCYETIRPTPDSTTNLLRRQRQQHPSSSATIVFDRFQSNLQKMQCDLSTYTFDPCDEPKYLIWSKGSMEELPLPPALVGVVDNNDVSMMGVSVTFDLDRFKGEASDLLVNNQNVRSAYTQLVPKSVSNGDFWKRYFYHKHLLEEEEVRIGQLMLRAELQDNRANSDLGWDEEEELGQECTTSKVSQINQDPHVLTDQVQSINNRVQSLLDRDQSLADKLISLDVKSSIRSDKLGLLSSNQKPDKLTNELPPSNNNNVMKQVVPDDFKIRTKEIENETVSVNCKGINNIIEDNSKCVELKKSVAENIKSIVVINSSEEGGDKEVSSLKRTHIKVENIDLKIIDPINLVSKKDEELDSVKTEQEVAIVKDDLIIYDYMIKSEQSSASSNGSYSSHCSDSWTKVNSVDLEAAAEGIIPTYEMEPIKPESTLRRQIISQEKTSEDWEAELNVELSEREIENIRQTPTNGKIEFKLPVGSHPSLSGKTESSDKKEDWEEWE